MPKISPKQPRLISEAETEFKITPEEQAIKDEYLVQLRQHLRDPEFRQTQGFPIGDDEAILELSDPPHYTACPNPFLPEIIDDWQTERDEFRLRMGLTDFEYQREPFSADVSEGKSNSIYRAHTYHTKVPHPAIMRYILHYTDPGDIVFDGFCGTGMTGVAAQLCGNRAEVTKLGYFIDEDGRIYQKAGDDKPISRLGNRKVVLSDLAPLASFISYNYVTLDQKHQFISEALKIVDNVENLIGWVYEFDKCRVLNTIWSDVFICPNCSGEIVFWDAAQDDGKLRKYFPCPSCNSIVGKSSSKKMNATKLERSFEIRFDPVLQKSIRVPTFIPVMQKITNGEKKIQVRIPQSGLAIIDQLLSMNDWPTVPTDQFQPGRQTNKLINGTGISYICHMYTPRALFVLGHLWQQQLKSSENTYLFKFCLSDSTAKRVLDPPQNSKSLI